MDSLDKWSLTTAGAANKSKGDHGVYLPSLEKHVLIKNHIFLAEVADVVRDHCSFLSDSDR